jgi:hypothetical protein
MRNIDTFPVLPELSTIDFSCTSEVRELIKERCHHLFSPQEDCYIDAYMDVTEDLFAGRPLPFMHN